MTDLSAAEIDLAAARDAESSARAALTAAGAEIDEARSRFFAEPSTDLDNAVERAEAGQRSAERFAQARGEARARAEQAHSAAVRADARARLTGVRDQAGEVLDEAGRIVEDACELYERLAALVERAHALVGRDEALATEAQRLAGIAGLSIVGVPLELSTLRVAVGIRLAQEWDQPPLPRDLPKSEILRLIAELPSSESSTQVEFRTRLHRVAHSGQSVYGTEACEWLRLSPAPAWTESGGSYAIAHDLATRLLSEIDNEGKDEQ